MDPKRAKVRIRYLFFDAIISLALKKTLQKFTKLHENNLGLARQVTFFESTRSCYYFQCPFNLS